MHEHAETHGFRCAADSDDASPACGDEGACYLPSVRWLIPLVLPGLGACMFLVDTEGLAGPVPVDASANDGKTADDSVDAREEAPADATIDAQVSPCTGVHLFCDDFDTGILESRWDVMHTEAGPLTLSSEAYVSASRSLRAVVYPGTGVRRTSLRKTVAVPAKTVRFEVDVLSIPPTEGTYRQVDIVAIAMIPPSAGLIDEELGLRYNATSGQVELEWVRQLEGGGTDIEFVPVVLPPGRWVHLTIEADASAATGLGRLYVDGVHQADMDISGASPQAVELRVGPDYTKDAELIWPMSFDNVVVDP